MKATGIVRRIDDLGRVVIPKEIRRTMRIREGDPLEIYTSRDGEVIFKKYSLLGGVEDFAGQLRAARKRWAEERTDELISVTEEDVAAVAAEWTGIPVRRLTEDEGARLLELEEIHTLRCHWVKGHAENEYNNRCDELAVMESQKHK